MNRTNLIKLANYFSQHKKLKADFDMHEYCEYSHFIMSTNCGSIGCAIGHGPYAGIDKYANEYWREYSERVFGIDICSRLWDFLFSSAWTDVDNTKIGVVRRINYVLKNGHIPDDFNTCDISKKIVSQYKYKKYEKTPKK